MIRAENVDFYTFKNQMIPEYLARFDYFVDANKLALYFANIPDHLAWKAANTEQFYDMIDSLKPVALQISQISIGDRLITTALLKQAVEFGRYGKCRVLEIMQPKPGTFTPHPTRLDHVEFCNNTVDRSGLKEKLTKQKVFYKERDQRFHTSLEIKSADGIEVKFTNIPLLSNVRKQVQLGQSQIIYSAG